MKIFYYLAAVILITFSYIVKNEKREVPTKVSEILKDTSDFVFNTDYMNRDLLLEIDPNWKGQNGGIEHVEISIELLDKLLTEKYIDPNESQNESPTTREFYYFMNKFPKTIAHGYVVAPDRSDSRITLEGLYAKEIFVTKEMKKQFFDLCKDADEFDEKRDLYSWWD